MAEPEHHHHGHGDGVMDEAAWDERYRTAPALWSGRPNPNLVAEATGLSPGRALDAGCGEGADAIWLAERGWEVIAVDLSSVALERAAVHAATLGDDLARRISWQHADLLRWAPPAASFDLVSAQFLHLPADQRDELLRRLAAAVAPGGTLLVVGHDWSDTTTGVPRPSLPDRYFRSSDVAALLPAGWQIVVDESRAREVLDADGATVTVHDVVVRAERAGRVPTP